MPHPDKIYYCAECQEAAFFDAHCGAIVCAGCVYHNGLARCYCGWSLSEPVNGINELTEMGENLDPPNSRIAIDPWTPERFDAARHNYMYQPYTSEETIGHARLTPQEAYDHENPAPLENPMDWEK